MQRNRNLEQYWWGCKMVQLPWKTVQQFLTPLNMELLHGPARPFLGIHTQEK